MAPQWTREAIEALICAYREEQCLYMVKSANYYNRKLRAEALKRVANAVSLVRANTTTKDCFAKMHGLRNQFNVEHAKVQSSKNSGNGLDEVYVPSLWYYKKLIFMAQHYIPRKSKCLGQVSDNSTTTEDTSSQSASGAQCSSQCSEETFSLGQKVLNPICIIVRSEEPLTTQSHSPVPSLVTPPGPSTAPGPMTAPGPSMATVAIGPTTPPLPPAQGTPSRCKSRERSSDSCEWAIEVKTEEVCATQQQQKSADASLVDSFATFIGSYIKEIKSGSIQFQLMSDIHKIVMDAKLKDSQQQ